MSDALAISAIIISLISAIKTFVTDTHIQKCHTCCVDSDCRQSKKATPPDTPLTHAPQRDTEPAILPLTEAELRQIITEARGC